MEFNWNNVKPACCAKWLVLPTVYSDALSYGEQLDKFCYQLNQLISNNNILPDFIAELIKEYINSGAVGEVVRDILADYILNVKYPPEGITPAVGDGSADDTDAIQGCIDYAAENGGVVYFPYGSYLTQPLSMKDGVSLFGFDRYSTKIVLKGGATNPLIGGTVADFSIANLTLDGNSGIQVNDVNVVTLMATNVLFTNLIIKDGYTLVNYVGTGGHFQISDVVFGNAVEKCLLTAGNADVQCENVVFNQLSAVGGISVMDIGTDGGFFNVKSLATCNQCIVITGNNNKISAIVENAAIPVVDNGLQNNIEIFGVSNKEFYSGDTSKKVNGDYSKHIGGTYTKAVDGNATESVDGNFSSIVTGVSTETFQGNRTVTETNKTINTNGVKTETVTGKVTENYQDDNEENITGSKIINATDIILNPTNPLGYKSPTALNKIFNYVPFKDPNNDTYNVLTNSNVELVNPKSDITLYGGSTELADNLPAINEAISYSGYAYVPAGTYTVSQLPDFTKINGVGLIKYNNVLIPSGNILENTVLNMSVLSFDFIDTYIKDRRIFNTLTLYFPTGSYTFNRNIAYQHIDGFNIHYLGDGSTKSILKFDFTGKEASGIGAFRLNGNYTIGLIDKITIDGDNWSGRTGGDPTEADGHPNDPQGIVATNGGVIYVGTDVVVQYFARCGIIAFSGGSISAIGVTSRYNGSDGIVASSGSFGLFNNCISEYNYGYGIYADYGGNLWCSGGVSRYNHLNYGGRIGIGIGANYGGVVYAPNCVVSNNEGAGFAVISGGILFATGSTVTNNNSYGVRCEDNGVAYLVGSNISNNENSGINNIRNSFVNATNCTVNQNKTSGITTAYGSNTIISGITVDNNEGYGINANNGYAFGNSINSISNNTTTGCNARYSGVIDMFDTSSTKITGNGTDFSPTNNTTTGIDNSYIYTANS